MLYRQGMLRGKMPHFRLTSDAQKRLCLSSLLYRQNGTSVSQESLKGGHQRQL